MGYYIIFDENKDVISTQFSRLVIHGLKIGDPWPHLLQYEDTTPLFDMRFAWWGKGISLIGHLMGAWGGCGWAWRLQLCRGVWLQLSGVDGVMICQVRSDPFPGKCRKLKTWVGYGISNYAVCLLTFSQRILLCACYAVWLSDVSFGV